MYKVSLKAARVNANMTQKEAAAKLGVSTMAIVKWERGEDSTIPLATFHEMCSLYGVPADVISLQNV